MLGQQVQDSQRALQFHAQSRKDWQLQGQVTWEVSEVPGPTDQTIHLTPYQVLE